MLKSTCIQLGPDEKAVSTKQAIGKNSELKTEGKIQAALLTESQKTYIFIPYDYGGKNSE